MFHKVQRGQTHYDNGACVTRSFVCKRYCDTRSKFRPCISVAYIMHAHVLHRMAATYACSSTARVPVLNVHICVSTYMCTYYSRTVESAGQQCVAAGLR